MNEQEQQFNPPPKFHIGERVRYFGGGRVGTVQDLQFVDSGWRAFVVWPRQHRTGRIEAWVNANNLQSW